jgi:branched-chain amino acid aminotransferase
MKLEPVVYLHSRFLPFSHAGLSLHDAGFVHGATATERFRTFGGTLFRLDDHLRRFRRSCELARIPQPRSDAELTQRIGEVIEANRHLSHELALLMFATPGPVGSLAGEEGNGPPTLGIYAIPLNLKRYRAFFEIGASVVFSPVLVSPEAIDPRIKHRSRLHWWIAEQSFALPARNLLYVAEGTNHVRETSVANFLCLKGGCVVSPPRDRILNGIALQVVEELCQDLRIPFAERELTSREVLADSEECWLTNSTFGLAAISRLEEVPLAWPGPTYQRLLAAYSDRVGVDLRRQILAD